MKRKQLLVTGCGRSGTRYITSLLRLMGLRVKHEHLGRDGIVSWCAAVDAKEVPWGDSISGYQFKHVFHQVRHPLAVIPSLLSFQERSWMYICRYTPCTMEESVLLRSIKYWYYWNILAQEKASWTYQIESLPIVFDVFCQHLQINKNEDILIHLPRTIHNRERGILVHYYEELCDLFYMLPNPVVHDRLSARQNYMAKSKRKFTWEELKQISLIWYEKIRDKAQEYGYSS